MKRRLPADNQEAGYVLIQVLGIVSIASAIVLQLLSIQDATTALRQRQADDLQARALALSAESSVVTAFRQDAEVSPGIDHYGEEWAARAQVPIHLDQADFSVAVTDAQSRYDLNRLSRGNLSDASMMARIGESAGLGPEQVEQLTASMELGGPIDDLPELSDRGITKGDQTGLEPYVRPLSGQALVNMNTASADLVRTIFDNPANSARFLSLRDRQGYVTAEDLSRQGLILPAGAGLQTDHLIVEAQVRVGRSDVRMVSLLQRTSGEDGAAVEVVRRRFGR
jgi:general secretion pathway protein K